MDAAITCTLYRQQGTGERGTRIIGASRRACNLVGHAKANQILDWHGGLWCVNIGYGRRTETGGRC